MTNISEPYTTANILGAPAPVPNAAQKILVPAQMTSAGTGTANELIENITKAKAKALGGTGGMLYDVISDMLDINQNAAIDVVLVDDPAGDAAVGNILWDGLITEAGTLEVGCGHFKNGVAKIGLTEGLTSDNVAALVTTEFAKAALENCLATVTTDGVTTDQNNFTHNNVGTVGNNTPLWVKFDGDGLTWTITGFTGGTGVPTLTTFFDAIGDARYQRIPSPEAFGTDFLTDHLDPLFNVENAVKDGVGIFCASDTAANHVTALNALNSLNLDYLAESVEDKSWYKGTNGWVTGFNKACRIAAIDALRLTAGTNITAYVNASAGARDGVGGPALASLPYYNTPLNIPVSPTGFGFKGAEPGQIEAAHGFLVGNNDSNTAVVMGQRRTTYKFDNGGNVDVVFKFRNYVDTYSAIREYEFNNIKRDCNQSRLTEGGLIGGRIMNNAGSVKTKLLRYTKTLAGAEYALVEAGELNAKFIEQNTKVEINKSSGLVNVVEHRMAIVTQAREIKINILFAFSVNG